MVGNKPNYSQFDVLRCFFRLAQHIKEKKNTSRNGLSKSLDLGEGTIRTILDILKVKNLIISTNRGHFLSNFGKSTLNELEKGISIPKKIESNCIFHYYEKSAILIKDIRELTNTYKLRDIAVKNGSEGAIILKYYKRLYAPESNEFDYSELEKFFELESGDVIILTFADSYAVAENSALAVASELSSALKSFINRLSA